MSARYWMLLSDDLVSGMFGPLTLPEGLRFASPPDAPPPYVTAEPRELDNAHWHLMEDDGADPELDGERVMLVFRRGEDGRARIVSRQAVSP